MEVERRERFMDDSILDTIKKMNGVTADYTVYDTDFIVFINGAMMTLNQLGVGPKEGFTISGRSETWDDFLPSDSFLDGVKQYIFLHVKMLFDPPQSSIAMEAYKQQKEEMGWRLKEQAEYYSPEGPKPGYWQQVEEEEKAAKESLDDGDECGPFWIVRLVANEVTDGGDG
jgi:hypothetical protein